MKIRSSRVFSAALALVALSGCTPYTQIKQQRLEAVPLSA